MANPEHFALLKQGIAARKIYEQIYEQIRLHEKLLLVLSKHSMKSDWVEAEIAKARQREKRERRERRQIKSSGTAVLGTVENTLKTIVAALGIFLGMVTGLGFPAVCLHFFTFGVPTSFISYNHALWAGVLPTILLGLFGTYLYWAAKEFQSGMIPTRFSLIPIVVSGPLLLLFIPLALVLHAGMLVMCILMAWAIFCPFVWLISRFFSIDISNRLMLYAAIAVFLIGVIIIYWRRRGDKSDSTETSADKTDRFAYSRLLRTFDLISNFPKAITGREFIGNLIEFFTTISIMLILSLYAVKGVLYLWEPSWSRLLSITYILGLGITGALIYSVLVVVSTSIGWLENNDRQVKLMGMVCSITLLVVLFLAAISIYASILYPRLPQGLGGGKPTQVVLWVDKDDLPPDIRGRLPASLFTDQGSMNRIEHIYLFSQDEKSIILVDRPIPPASGFLVLKEKIKAISW